MSDLQFQKCRKPDCFRKIKIGTQYCCQACVYADERKFELDDQAPPPLGHWSTCNGRRAERGEYSFYEANLMKQTGAP